MVSCPSLCPGDPTVAPLVPQPPHGTACQEERLGTWWMGNNHHGCSEDVLQRSCPLALGCVVVSKCPMACAVGWPMERRREPVLWQSGSLCLCREKPLPPPQLLLGPSTTHGPNKGWLSPARLPGLVGQGWAQPPFPLPVPPVPRLVMQPFVPNNRLLHWGSDKEKWHVGSIPLTPHLHSLSEVASSSRLLPASACPWCACPWHAPCQAAGVRMAARPPCRAGQPLLNSFP